MVVAKGFTGADPVAAVNDPTPGISREVAPEVLQLKLVPAPATITGDPAAKLLITGRGAGVPPPALLEPPPQPVRKTPPVPWSICSAAWPACC